MELKKERHFIYADERLERIFDIVVDMLKIEWYQHMDLRNGSFDFQEISLMITAYLFWCYRCNQSEVSLQQRVAL